MTDTDRPNPLLGAAFRGGLPFDDDRSDSKLIKSHQSVVPAVSGQVGRITPILHIWTGLRFGSASAKCTAVLSHSMCLLLSSDEKEFDVDTVAVYRSCCQERVLSLCTDMFG